MSQYFVLDGENFSVLGLTDSKTLQAQITEQKLADKTSLYRIVKIKLPVFLFPDLTDRSAGGIGLSQAWTSLMLFNRDESYPVHALEHIYIPVMLDDSYLKLKL